MEYRSASIRHMFRIFRVTACLAVMGIAATALAPVHAATLRWANDADARSMDPYFGIETFLASFLSNIYEPLVRRKPDLQLEPCLAVEWKQTSDTTWVFKLRPNVKFHDGSSFSAEDVVFSYERATGPGSAIKPFFSAVKSVKKIDDLTVEFETKGPDPILPDELSSWLIMSKRWATEKGALTATGVNGGDENFSTRNANGTGPFVLVKREPEVQTVLKPFGGWWDTPTHNLTSVVFSKIAAPGTRIAALIAGDVDLVTSVPTQAVETLKRSSGVKVMQTPELRTILLGFDHQRDELPGSNVKGRNPLKDRRVREAIYRAIDINGIRSAIMKGLSSPTNMLVAEGIRGFDAKLNKRPPSSPDEAKKLLAEAGYPNGFQMTMDCPNDRYVNDEAICQAVTNMLARVGVRVDLKARDGNHFFEKVFAPKYDTSFFLLGWTPSSYDIQSVYERLLHTRQTGARGIYNLGNYSNPELDKLIDQIAVELNAERRRDIVNNATRIIQTDVAVIPLHQQVLVWAARQNVTLTQMPDNYMILRSVNVR